MVTQNHFEMPATVLEKFRFQRLSLKPLSTVIGKDEQYLRHHPRRPRASKMSSDTTPGDSEEGTFTLVMS